MQIINLDKNNVSVRQLTNVRPILLIGNFDGVHIGHQYLIKQALTLAKEEKTLVAVMSFTPHPGYYFQKNIDGFSITTLKQKEFLLAKFGVDYFFNTVFDEFTANTTAHNFIEKFIYKTIFPAHIIIGNNFRFGRGREGDVKMLKKVAKNYDIDVSISDLLITDDGVVSSSNIRKMLRKGMIQQANSKLGWNWFLDVNLETINKEVGEVTASYIDDKIIKVKSDNYISKLVFENNSNFQVFSLHDSSNYIKIFLQDRNLCNALQLGQRVALYLERENS